MTIRERPEIGRGASGSLRLEDGGRLAESYEPPLEAVDPGERARFFGALVDGCRSAAHPFFIPIQRVMIDLERFSAEGSVMEDEGAHGLWTMLKSELERALGSKASLPRAIFPLLTSEVARSAFQSLSKSLKGHLFDFLVSAYPSYVDGPLSWLRIRPLEEMNELSEIKRYISEIASYEERFEMKLLDNPDPGFELAKMTVGLIQNGLRGNFRQLLDDFCNFQLQLSNLLTVLDGAESRGEGAAMRSWRTLFSENEDLFRDADNLLTSLDVTFGYLSVYHDREALGEMLEALRTYGFLQVSSIVGIVLAVNAVRAGARNTRLEFDPIPGIEVPEGMRTDLFRAVNELVLNAVVNSNLHAEGRRVHVGGRLSDEELLLEISDNGPGIEGRSGIVREDGVGGIGRVARIAGRHGWRFSLGSGAEGGTKASLAMDIDEWGGSSESLFSEEACAVGATGLSGAGPMTQPLGAFLMLPSIALPSAF